MVPNPIPFAVPQSGTLKRMSKVGLQNITGIYHRYPEPIWEGNVPRIKSNSTKVTQQISTFFFINPLEMVSIVDMNYFCFKLGNMNFALFAKLYNF